MKLIISIVFLSILMTCNSQDSQFYFISKTDINRMGINEIKVYADDTPGYEDIKTNNSVFTKYHDTSSYMIYTFKNGRLKEIKPNDNQSLEYKYLDSNYYLNWKETRKHKEIKENIYTDSILKCLFKNHNGFYVFEIEGGGGRDGWPCYIYDYNDYENKLKSITVSSCSDSGDDVEGLTEFVYYPDGRINYEIAYSIKTNIDTHIPIDTTETKRKFYIYKDKILVGYFPAKEEQYPPILSSSDTIYSYKKRTELKEIGLTKFTEKYFNDDISKKIIEDCYSTVSKMRFFINGKTIKEFFLKYNNIKFDHIIIEIAENYFLFYKIND